MANYYAISTIKKDMLVLKVVIKKRENGIFLKLFYQNLL